MFVCLFVFVCVRNGTAENTPELKLEDAQSGMEEKKF